METETNNQQDDMGNNRANAAQKLKKMQSQKMEKQDAKFSKDALPENELAQARQRYVCISRSDIIVF